MDPQLLLDETEIKRLRQRWTFARDYGDWADLADCFHPGAVISISWYHGDVNGFIEGAKAVISGFNSGEHGKHLLGNSRVWINGERAVAEVDVLIQSRVYLDSYLFDFSSRARFFDLVERRDGDWKICQWKAVYDADRMDAAEPYRVPAEFYEGIDLSPFPPACAFLCYRITRGGRVISKDIACINTDAEAQIKDEAQRWLEGTYEPAMPNELKQENRA